MVYLVYDLDGTLTTSAREITVEAITILEQLQNLGYQNVIVSGGTYQKIKWQLQGRTDLFQSIFSECGAVLHRQDLLIYQKELDFNYEDIREKYFKMCQSYGFEWSGERFDVRNGLIYLTPVGMTASDQLRNKFIEYEKHYHFRQFLITELSYREDLEIVKGGKTGVAVYKKGQDKTQILEHLSSEPIYFFGDNCQEGGNDKCLYDHSRCIGYAVKDYQETLSLLSKLFLN